MNTLSPAGKFYRLIIIAILSLSILMSACNWIDEAGTNAIDKGFGNTQPCSGIVC